MFNQALDNFLISQGYSSWPEDIEIPLETDPMSNANYPNAKFLYNSLRHLKFHEEYIPYIFFKDNKFFARIYTRSQSCEEPDEN